MARHFSEWIQNEMEEKLTACPDLGFLDTPPTRVKIAMTALAFNNSEMILMLQRRGKLIKDQKWEELRKINREMNTFLG